MIEAMVPTAALLTLGLLLKLFFRFDDNFWRGAEQLTYFLLLPALFINSLGKAQFGDISVGKMALVIAGASVASAIFGLAVKPIVGTDGPGFTSVYQGIVRFNNYVGATVSAALFGAEGLALAALCNAILIPLGNIYSTLALAKWGTAHVSGWGVAKALLTNPLVGACFIGLGFNAINDIPFVAKTIQIPMIAEGISIVSTILALIGQAALPLGLLCVGAGLSRAAAGHVSQYAQPLTVASIGRLVVVPLLAFGMCMLLGLGGHAAVIVVLFQALPTASSCYILARQMGGDAPLSAVIIAAQTIFAMVSLPIWILAANVYF